MARFSGPVGYAVSTQTSPGVWEDVITEKPYRGDIVQNNRKSSEGEGLNNDISLSNSVSIVADAYANEHFHAIRYVKWAGAYWNVTSVDASKRPRLTLRLGGVYNGPTA